MSDTETTETTVEMFDIPEWNMEIVEARLIKLNKRADKLGSAHLSIVIHEEKFIVDPRASKEERKSANPPKIKIVVISIDGAGPKLEGWKFIGTLDHVSLEGSVIVNTVPGEIVPKEFHNNAPVCDHCNRIRNRKETFVVENETGELKQVGRSCIKDFLGHDPSKIARYLQSLYDLMDELGDNDSSFYGGSGETYYTLLDVLKNTAGVIRLQGWTPRSAANENRSATAFEVSYMMNFIVNSKERKLQEAFIAEVGVNAEDEDQATKALAWLTEQNADNEYMHNIKAIGGAKEIRGRLMGYACSIIAAYQRAMNSLEIRKNEEANKLNEYISGEIKDRVEMVISVINTRLIDSHYGTVELFRMMDDNGRTVTWFANSASDLEKGKTYRVLATLKKFEEYKDWKQTTVTRLRILEEL